MAHHVEHLHSAQAVDDAICREGESGRLAIVRFGRSGHDDYVRFDAALAAAAERLAPVAALIAIDIDEVQDFNAMYELHQPCTVMFFYWNCHVMVRGRWSDDLKQWAAYTADEFVGLVQQVHARAKPGRLLVLVD